MSEFKNLDIFCIEVYDTENYYNYGNPLIPKRTITKSICYGENWLKTKLEQLSSEFENYDCKISNETLSKVLYLGNISNQKVA